MKLCYIKGPFDGWGNLLFFCLNGGGLIEGTKTKTLIARARKESSFVGWVWVY